MNGILDPEGIHPNPLNGKEYSDKYRETAKKWSKFPIYTRAKEIIEDIRNNQVILMMAETGAGKSVLTPKFALHAFNYNANIAMCLPKILITVAAAEHSAIVSDVTLGEEIGYQYKGSPANAKSSKTKLLYCTDGLLIAKLYRDISLKEYDCILLDEVHERSVNIDLLIYLLRETLKIRPNFKVIFMSATVNHKLFISYFIDFKFKLINVEGQRLFPIESHYLRQKLDYKLTLKEGLNTAIKILESDDPSDITKSHDIIFFVTSSSDAFELCKNLRSYMELENS